MRCENALRASAIVIVSWASRRALSVAIPRTTSAIVRPEGVSTARRSPTRRWWAFAKAFVRTVPVVPRLASVALEPRSQSIR